MAELIVDQKLSLFPSFTSFYSRHSQSVSHQSSNEHNGEAPVMFFGKKSASADNTSESKPCCASKSKEPHTHAPAEKATVTAKPSIFEFFSSASGDDRDGDARAMLGHCTAVEGGLNACVWVPTNERQHKIVF